MNETQELEAIHLSEYFNIIRKRKNIVIAFFFCAVALLMLISFLTKPVYQSSATLVIDPEQTTSPITGQKLDLGGYQSEQLTFNTHFKLITSTPVISLVARELRLDAKHETVESNPLRAAIKQIRKNLKTLLKKEEQELSEDDKLNQLVGILQDNISIKAIRETRLLSINVENNDADLAANIASTLAKKYIEFNMSNKLEASKENLSWMHNELYSLKKKLEDDEQKFLEYKKEQNVFSVEGKQKVIGQKITEFNNEYLAAKNKRLELDEKLKEIDKLGNQPTGDMVHIRSIIGNPAIDSIYATLTGLEVELSKLSKVYKSKHPKMVQVNSELDKVRAKLQNELQKEVSNLKSMRSVLAAREQVMEKNIQEFEGDALSAGSKELKYNILQRNVTTSQSLYDTLLSKVKESNILASGNSSNIRIVENSTIPQSPIKPNKIKNLLIGIVLGLFGGIGLAFFLEYLDQTVRSEEDVTNYLNLQILSVIPVADSSDHPGTY